MVVGPKKRAGTPGRAKFTCVVAQGPAVFTLQLSTGRGNAAWQGRANMQVAHVGTLAGANHGAHLRKQASIAGAGFRKMATHIFMLLWSIVAASQSDNRNIRPITGNTEGIK